MASVVFLRGVNVGGHKRFKPEDLARESGDLGMVNIGAAGTFVVRNAIDEKALRTEITRRLPVNADIMICSAEDVLDLTSESPFPSGEGITEYVSVLAKIPTEIPPLPISVPAGDNWQAKLIEVRGRFALCIYRRLEGLMAYPNDVVEKSLGVRATARNWNTFCKIRRVLTE